MQKGVFYFPFCNLLIIWLLQNWKRSDLLYLRTTYRSFSVSIFHKPRYMLFPLKEKGFEARSINFTQKKPYPIKLQSLL